MRDRERQTFIYRTPQFERCLDDLRKKRGAPMIAAKKADEFISYLTEAGRALRKKFSFTWNGEYRIRNCVKIDLPCGYRLVCIKKGCHLILLYAGSHDDCFRWIERNKGLTCEVDWTSNSIITVQQSQNEANALPEDVLDEKIFAEQYEKKLMEQLDDSTLTRIFSGLCDAVKDRGPKRIDQHSL